MHQPSLQQRVGAVIVVVLLGVLTACGANDDDTPTGSSSAAAKVHNDADVAFASGMIPHHRQAVEMSTMATRQAAATRVKQLAGRIEAAQDPEITTMSGWLKAWGESVPTGTGHAMAGMHHAAPGMMTDEDMHKLGTTTGSAFDRMFLTMMIKHHTGAIGMAEIEIRDGENTDAKVLAHRIIAAQHAEIKTMNRLLG